MTYIVAVQRNWTNYIYVNIPYWGMLYISVFKSPYVTKSSEKRGTHRKLCERV